jgi:hypothetical protein
VDLTINDPFLAAKQLSPSHCDCRIAAGLSCRLLHALTLLAIYFALRQAQYSDQADETLVEPAPYPGMASSEVPESRSKTAKLLLGATSVESGPYSGGRTLVVTACCCPALHPPALYLKWSVFLYLSCCGLV